MDQEWKVNTRSTLIPTGEINKQKQRALNLLEFSPFDLSVNTPGRGERASHSKKHSADELQSGAAIIPSVL